MRPLHSYFFFRRQCRGPWRPGWESNLNDIIFFALLEPRQRQTKAADPPLHVGAAEERKKTTVGQTL